MPVLPPPLFCFVYHFHRKTTPRLSMEWHWCFWAARMYEHSCRIKSCTAVLAEGPSPPTDLPLPWDPPPPPQLHCWHTFTHMCTHTHTHAFVASLFLSHLLAHNHVSYLHEGESLAFLSWTLSFKFTNVVQNEACNNQSLNCTFSPQFLHVTVILPRVLFCFRL